MNHTAKSAATAAPALPRSGLLIAAVLMAIVAGLALWRRRHA